MIQPRPGLVLVRPKGSTNPADYQAMHESAIPAYAGLVELVPDDEVDGPPAAEDTPRPSRAQRRRAAADSTTDDEAAPAAPTEASGDAAATTAQEG